METLIIDIENDFKLIKKEVESINRKLERLKKERDLENIDSHIKAIASTLHSIYSGYKNILERIIRAVDGELPFGKEYHLWLLKRASIPIDNVRPFIISSETFKVLDELKTYRHKFRNIYLYLLSAERIIELADLGIKSFELFEKDFNNFKKFLNKKSSEIT